MTMIVQKSLFGEHCSEEPYLLDEAFLETSACLNPSGAFTVMSKKVKARKLTGDVATVNSTETKPLRSMTYTVYTKRPRSADPKPSFFDSLMDRIAGKGRDIDGWDSGATSLKKGKRELHGLGVVDMSSHGELGVSSVRGSRLRKETIHTNNLKQNSMRVQPKTGQHGTRKESHLSSPRKWVRLDISSVDPFAIIGCKCKVYWPLDNNWYIGMVSQFDSANGKHQVKYDDGEIEWIVLMDEEIKFCLSKEEMSHLNAFRCKPEKAADFNELMMLSTNFDDCGDFVHGEIVWAKITALIKMFRHLRIYARRGLCCWHAMWPAIVMDEVHAAACKGIKHTSVDRSLPVQFFGTYDYAMIKSKQIVPFYKGFLSSFHLKCKHARFVEALEETRRYFKERIIPEKIAQLQTGVAGGCDKEKDKHSTEEVILHDEMQPIDEGAAPCPFEVEDLCVLNLGKIVRDSEYFHNEKYTWPLGYCATRKFVSATDPRRVSEYKMEVLRNPKSKMLPLFRVTWDNGTQINGHFPTACWKKIYRRIRQASTDSRECIKSSIGKKSRCKSGAYMFGFCTKQVQKFIQCTHKTCRIAYHPLCARAAGLCVELEDEKNKLVPKSIHEEDDQCIRLVSFCKKHRKPSNESTPSKNETKAHLPHHSSHNFSTTGCARSEPYNFFGRRGHREPEALSSASSKRLYVENRPYLVSGYRKNGLAGDASSCRNHVTEKCNQAENCKENASKKFFSLSEKYQYMRSTIAKRLAFGKSRIHGFGVFAKCLHNAGDMIIEYVGEIVRPKIADRREQLFYNSLVPNCYSRVITVCGDEHIIVFARRDINSWEEITYDYRFLSINEQLRCYCGFPKCRGVVNDIEATGQAVKNSSLLGPDS